MADLLWLLLPALAAVGSGILSYCVMQARLDVALANERQDLAESRAACDAQRKTMEDTVRAVEEEVRRKALDEFLGELHVEERRYTRERRMLFMNRKSLVLEERMYFRNIPLSSWVEHELPIEEGVDIEQVARSLAVFSARLLPSGSPKLLSR
jgi:hypothetical protein